MRIFQYKILNNILYLNNRLYKFGYVESPMCSLCNSETETMTHLFCHCSKTDQMWNSLTSWCKGCLTLPVLEPSTAILGFFDIWDEKSKLINHILILFKFFLYANHKHKTRSKFPCTQAFHQLSTKNRAKNCFQRKQTWTTPLQMATNCPPSVGFIVSYTFFLSLSVSRVDLEIVY